MIDELTKEETLAGIKEDVENCFTRLEIIQMTDFEDFFSEVDVWNAYEESWETYKAFYKPFYESVYNDILKGK